MIGWPALPHWALPAVITAGGAMYAYGYVSAYYSGRRRWWEYLWATIWLVIFLIPNLKW